MLGFEWLCSESYYKFKEIENYNETAPLGNQREDMSLRPLFRGKKIIFPINYGVAQGFLALRKAAFRTTWSG